MCWIFYSNLLFFTLYNLNTCSAYSDDQEVPQDNKDDNQVVLLVNQILLTKKDVKTIQNIYKKEKKQDITLNDLDNLVKIYHYLRYLISAEEVGEMLIDQPPKEIIDQFTENLSISNLLVLLWNQDNLYKVMTNIAMNEEKSLKTSKKSNFFWQYIIVSGSYTNNPPNKKMLQILVETNLYPEKNILYLEKKYGLKNIKITFNELQEWDRKDFIDRKNKKFAIILHKSKMYTNIRYDLIIYEYNEIQQAVEGFQIIQDNKAILPEHIPNLMKYKNLSCKIKRTSIYSQDIDGGLAVILNNLPINQYSLIENSYYVFYVTHKAYCEENEETDEEKQSLLTKNYIANIIKKLNNQSLKKILEKLDCILYD